METLVKLRFISKLRSRSGVIQTQIPFSYYVIYGIHEEGIIPDYDYISLLGICLLIVNITI